MPCLDDSELAALSASSHDLSALLSVAPDRLKDLLRNVFNLSLAAELIDGGTGADGFANIRTQSDLISRYEDLRLDTDRLRIAVRKVVEVMVGKRRLSVLRSRVESDAIDDAVRSGVLTATRDKIAFAHHVLFDHAAGRYFLEYDDLTALLGQVADDPDRSFLLAPALRFALQSAWRDAGPGRAEFWRFVVDAAASVADPVILGVILRAAAEEVDDVRDVSGLLDSIRNGGDAAILARALDRLSRFVGLRADGAGGLSSAAAAAWAEVARQGVSLLNAAPCDGVRFLLMVLAKTGDFENGPFASAYGEAARGVLSYVWSLDSPRQNLAAQAIEYVSKSYASDADASRALLVRVFDPARFEQHAHVEIPALARNVEKIAQLDPEFAVAIYRAVFEGRVNDDAPAPLGGVQSQLMPLSMSRRQMFGHARWVLSEAYPAFLAAYPDWATRAASAVSIVAYDAPSNSMDTRIESSLADGRKIVLINRRDTLEDWRSKQHYDDEAGRLLEAFAEHLQTCPVETFSAIVATAMAQETATVVWKRILGVGGDRIEREGEEGVAELLWPVAASTSLLETFDTRRDTAICLAAAYPSRSKEARAAFEKAMVDWLAEMDDQTSWREEGASRVLSQVPAEQLVTQAARDLRARLAEAGDLQGNRPYMTVRTGWDSRDAITDRMLEHRGAKPFEGVDGAVRSVARPLEDALKAPHDDDVSRIVDLWSLLGPLLQQLGRAETEGAHPEVLRSSWGAIGEVAAAIAESDAWTPGADGQPSLAEVTDLVDRLAASPWPEAAEGQADDVMVWGDWDVRVHAATALMQLCRRFGQADLSLLDRLAAPAFDVVPTVRLQVLSTLHVLWEVAPDEMWALIEKIGRAECNRGLIGHFTSGPLAQLSGPAPDRVEDILSGIMARVPLRAEGADVSARDEMAEAAANLAAHLWVGRARPAAKAWIDGWLADPVAHDAALWRLTSDLRAAMFDRYMHPEEPEAAGFQARAKEIVDRLIAAAAGEVGRASADLEKAEEGSAEAKAAAERYGACLRLVDHAMSQIYFGSGAFEDSRRDRDRPGLANDDAKRAFLSDYRDTLEAIAAAGSASALHHQAELYGFLVSSDPAEVFDRWSTLVVGEGNQSGYEFEPLAASEFVDFVRLYLADHREVFADSGRRDRLIRVLNRFSDAGWPEALQLLYELPDLLR